MDAGVSVYELYHTELSGYTQEWLGTFYYN